MCRKNFNIKELKEQLGIDCIPTHHGFALPLVKVADDLHKSVMLYYADHKMPVNREGKIIVNPFQFLPDPEIMASMCLGLPETAELLWTKALQWPLLSEVKSNELAQNKLGLIEAEEFTAGSGESVMEMVGIELAIPAKATHWFVRVPQDSADRVNLSALERDASGIWWTSAYLYFLVPRGYMFTAEGADDKFFAENVKSFTERCQAQFDAPIDQQKREDARLRELPLMREAAGEFQKAYKELVASAMLCLTRHYGEGKIPELKFDTTTDQIMYNDQVYELSKETFTQLQAVFLEVQQIITDFAEKSKEVEVFRTVIQNLKKDFTVTDYYGGMSQTAARKPWPWKTVEVALLEDKAQVMVFRGDKQIACKEFTYAGTKNVALFSDHLDELFGIKNDYDLDRRSAFGFGRA